MTTKVGKDILKPDAQTGLPTTTKGDLVVHSGAANVRLPVGPTGTVLVARASASSGVAWETFPGRVVGELSMFALTAPPPLWLLCDGREVNRAVYAALFAALGIRYGDGDGVSTFNLPGPMAGRVLVAEGIGVKGFDVSSVNTALNELTVPENDDLQTGAEVVYTSSGSPAGGLASGNTYYCIRVNSTTIRLSSSRAIAVQGVGEIDLTSAGSGAQSITVTLSARTAGEAGGEESHSLTAIELPIHSHSVPTIPSTRDVGGVGSLPLPVAIPGTSQGGSIGGSTPHSSMPPYYVGGIVCIYAGV